MSREELGVLAQSQWFEPLLHCLHLASRSPAQLLESFARGPASNGLRGAFVAALASSAERPFLLDATDGYGYAWFTEGFDTKDLIEAEALRAELG